LAVLALLAAACNGPAPAAASPTPTASVDIKRTKLDISYASLSDQDVHKVSSKKILEGAVAAINAEINKTGGKDMIGTIEFQDVTETTVPDFKKFAEAAAAVKAKNPQITADRYADVAIEGMMSATPDCHTYYVDPSAAVSTSARKEWRLPDAYQLPLAVILNDRGGSGPEVFAADLKENKRATIVGGKSVGCMGATSVTNMTDGSRLAVVVQEFTGANT